MSLLWLGYVLAGTLSLTRPGATVDTVVVCPTAWQGVMQPWVEYRHGQGHACVMVSSQRDAAAIRDQIRTLSTQHSLRYVVLIGDAPALATAGKTLGDLRFGLTTPTFYETSKVVVKYGSTETIASDQRYGDLDDDGLPELAVGRIPVDTSDELGRVLRKTLAYEQSLDHDGWQRRIHFIAGTSGIGPLADAAIESTTKSLLREHIPAGYATTMTYANWQSPYCPDPASFRATTIDRFNEGCLFWIYLGHGLPQTVDFVHVPGDRHPVFDVYAMPRLDRRAAAPMAFLFACYTGAFDARQDCLAEELLKAPGGAVAAVAATRVTMPYAMSVWGLELLDEYFQGQHATLGDVLLRAKRRTIERPRDDAPSRALDGLAKLLNPFGPDLIDERREHLLLFNLLGDPLLKVPQVGAARVDSESQVAAGSWLDVRGELMGAQADAFTGSAEVDLVVRRDRLVNVPALRSAYPATDAERAALTQDYHRANEQRLARQTVAVTRGHFQTRLWVPLEAAGDCHVRAYLSDGRHSAVGACDIEVIAAGEVALKPIATPR